MTARRDNPDRRFGPIPTATRERALDRLRCPTGLNHDVRMEWETRGGLRTGDLIAYCWTCRKQVADPTTPAPRDTYEYRQSKAGRERRAG